MPLYGTPTSPLMQQRPGTLWSGAWRVGGVPAAVAPSYVGPGDIVAGATAWYGLRGYSAAYATPGTNKAINIRRASDNATMDIVIKPDGSLDVATAAAFCAATTGFVAVVYDQTGHGRDMTQATAAAQPALVFSALGALPCLQTTSNAQLLTAPTFTSSGVVTLSMVGNRATTILQSNFIRLSNGSGHDRMQCGISVANQWLLAGAAGTLNGNATDAAWHAANGVINGASSVFNIDGVEVTGGVNGSTVNSTPQLLSGVNVMTLDLTEAGYWDAIAFAAGDRASMNANQHAYWGF